VLPKRFDPQTYLLYEKLTKGVTLRGDGRQTALEQKCGYLAIMAKISSSQLWKH